MSLVIGTMSLWEEFVSQEEEQHLVEAIDGRLWVDSQSGRRKQVRSFYFC